MYDWCHSGLEGYCKSAAEMLVDSIDLKEQQDANRRSKADGDVLLSLCQDLLPDRSKKNLTRAWKLSNERQGRDNRLSLFEKQWLGGNYGGLYRDEALLFSKGMLPGEGYLTIHEGSKYEQSLKAAVDRDDLERIAIDYCELAAVTACVKHAKLLLDDPKASEASTVASLVMVDDFPVQFFNRVIPAIERGFLSERYQPSDIQQYTLTLTGYARDAHYCLVDDSEGVALEPFLKFFATLVAGLIYGPNHPLAIGEDGTATRGYDPYKHKVALDGDTIRLMQVFDERCSYSGYSELFHPSQVVFLGRCPDEQLYEKKCKELFANERDVLNSMERCERVVFPIAQHDAVSNVHGMLMHDGVWRYYDLGSYNGTSIKTEGCVIAVDSLAEVRPGDVIRLGAPIETDILDSNVYWYAASILVSLYVNRSEENVD